MTDSRGFRRYSPLLSFSLVACALNSGSAAFAGQPPKAVSVSSKHAASPSAAATQQDAGDGDIMSMFLGTPGEPQVRVVASAPPAWYPLFAQALAASRAGKRAESEKLYRKLLKAQPTIPEAWANLGIMEAQDHNTEAAIADSRKAVALSKDPHFKASLLTQIMQLNARGNHWQECAVAAKETIAANPEGSPPNVLANAYLGISLLHLGRYADAVAPLRKRALLIGEPAPAADMRLILALEQSGRLDEAFSEAQQLAGRLPKDPRAQSGLGNIAAMLQRFGVALNAFGTAYTLQPDDTSAGLNAVTSAVRLGRNDIAFDLLKKMLKHSPDEPKVHFALGMLYFYQPASTVKQFSDAETNLRLAATSDPKGANYVTMLGHSILMQKNPQRFQEAGHLFDSALQLNKHDDLARLGLAYLAEQQVQFDKDKAAEHYLEAIAQYKAIIQESRNDASEAKARRRLAGIDLTLGEKDDGYREFEALVTRFPTDSVDLGELATIYYGDARYKEAASAYRRLIAITPNNPAPMVGLGQALEQMKNPTEARAQYEAALKAEPGNGTAALALGNLLKSQNKKDEAIAVYEATVKANSNNNQLHLQLGSDYEQQGRIDDALHQYEALTLKNDDPNRLTYLLMGPSLLLAHARSQEAETILTRMHNENPREDGILYKLATAQEGSGHPDAATATLLGLIAKHAGVPAETVTPRVELAELYERLHKPVEAGTAFEDTLRIDLSNNMALMGLSRVRTGQQHPEAAGTFLEFLALGDPAAPNMTAVNVAQHLYEVMDRTPERYAALLQHLTDSYPTDRALAQRRVAYLLNLDGIHKPENRVASQKLLQSMLVKTPNDPDLHYRLGTIREEDGRKAEAITEYTAAVKLNYGNTPAIAGLHRLGAAVPVPPPAAPPVVPLGSDKPAVATIPAGGARPNIPTPASPPESKTDKRP